MRIRRIAEGLLVVFMLISSSGASELSAADLTPIKSSGQKWRIAYVEGGAYQDYQATLIAFVKSLMEIGWMKETELPESQDAAETETLWSWLATDMRSDYLTFVDNAYWSAAWDDELRRRQKELVVQRLNVPGDIDLVLAFGTWAGLDLANDLHAVPTMLFSSSDPLRAGIVKSNEDSGYDHFHAKLDPGRYERQLRLFHEIIEFKKLGVAYQDNLPGRTYAALDDIHSLAKELDFDVLECPYLRQDAYSKEETQLLLACHQSLAPEIDAFYLTLQSGVNKDTLAELLEPFFEFHVPTFAQGRTYEVKSGVLMSMAQPNFYAQAQFHAEIFARILHGESPRSLPMIFEEPQEIAVNLEIARRIGFRFPLDVLAGAREIYEKIEEAD